MIHSRQTGESLNTRVTKTIWQRQGTVAGFKYTGNEETITEVGKHTEQNLHQTEQEIQTTVYDKSIQYNKITLKEAHWYHRLKKSYYLVKKKKRNSTYHLLTVLMENIDLL